jgi:hypothetical protein
MGQRCCVLLLQARFEGVCAVAVLVFHRHGRLFRHSFYWKIEGLVEGGHVASGKLSENRMMTVGQFALP